MLVLKTDKMGLDFSAAVHQLCKCTQVSSHLCISVSSISREWWFLPARNLLLFITITLMFSFTQAFPKKMEAGNVSHPKDTQIWWLVASLFPSFSYYFLPYSEECLIFSPISGTTSFTQHTLTIHCCRLTSSCFLLRHSQSSAMYCKLFRSFSPTQCHRKDRN